jgi:putative DNA methylase
LNPFLEEARPDRKRLPLVAQALAVWALSGRPDDGGERAMSTTAAKQGVHFSF